jgi:hypothetical protein
VLAKLNAFDDAEFKHRILNALTSLEHRMVALEHRMEHRMVALEHQMEHRMVALEHQMVTEVKKVLQNNNKEVHDFHGYQAALLQDMSMLQTCLECTTDNYCRKIFSTSHYIVYEGKLLRIGAKHCKCSDNIPLKYECNSIDVVLGFGCRPSNDSYYALNVSKGYPLRMGDTASSFGFISTGRQVLEWEIGREIRPSASKCISYFHGR